MDPSDPTSENISGRPTDDRRRKTETPDGPDDRRRPNSGRGALPPARRRRTRRRRRAPTERSRAWRKLRYQTVTRGVSADVSARLTPDDEKMSDGDGVTQASQPCVSEHPAHPHHRVGEAQIVGFRSPLRGEERRDEGTSSPPYAACPGDDENITENPSLSNKTEGDEHNAGLDPPSLIEEGDAYKNPALLDKTRRGDDGDVFEEEREKNKKLDPGDDEWTFTRDNKNENYHVLSASVHTDWSRGTDSALPTNLEEGDDKNKSIATMVDNDDEKSIMEDENTIMEDDTNDNPPVPSKSVYFDWNRGIHSALPTGMEEGDDSKNSVASLVNDDVAVYVLGDSASLCHLLEKDDDATVPPDATTPDGIQNMGGRDIDENVNPSVRVWGRAKNKNSPVPPALATPELARSSDSTLLLVGGSDDTAAHGYAADSPPPEVDAALPANAGVDEKDHALPPNLDRAGPVAKEEQATDGAASTPNATQGGIEALPAPRTTGRDRKVANLCSRASIRARLRLRRTRTRRCAPRIQARRSQASRHLAAHERPNPPDPPGVGPDLFPPSVLGAWRIDVFPSTTTPSAWGRSLTLAPVCCHSSHSLDEELASILRSARNTTPLTPLKENGRWRRGTSDTVEKDLPLSSPLPGKQDTPVSMPTTEEKATTVLKPLPLEDDGLSEPNFLHSPHSVEPVVEDLTLSPPVLLKWDTPMSPTPSAEREVTLLEPLPLEKPPTTLQPEATQELLPLQGDTQSIDEEAVDDEDPQDLCQIFELHRAVDDRYPDLNSEERREMQRFILHDIPLLDKVALQYEPLNQAQRWSIWQPVHTRFGQRLAEYAWAKLTATWRLRPGVIPGSDLYPSSPEGHANVYC